MRWHVAPTFWKNFEKSDNDQRGFKLFKSAVDDLYAGLAEFLPVLKRLEYLKQDKNDRIISNIGNKTEAQFKLLVRATLLSQLPLYHECIVEQFYKIAFNVFCNSDNSSQGKSQLFVMIASLYEFIEVKWQCIVEMRVLKQAHRSTSSNNVQDAIRTREIVNAR